MAVEPILDRAFEERLPTEPLTDTELEHLEGRNDVAGLPSTEVRRLFAEIRRLRRLAEVAGRLGSTVQTWDGGVPPSDTTPTGQDTVAPAKSNLHIE
jgi:hypothetical protein